MKIKLNKNIESKELVTETGFIWDLSWLIKPNKKYSLLVKLNVYHRFQEWKTLVPSRLNYKDNNDFSAMNINSISNIEIKDWGY